MSIKKNDILVANKAFNVGDTTFDKGTIFFVEKGGKSQKVFTTGDQGNMITLSGNFDNDGFTKKTVIEVSPCEKAFGVIEVKNIKRFATHDGYAMFADLFVDGKKVGMIENDGWGGETDLREDRPTSAGVYNRLVDTAKGLLVENNVEFKYMGALPSFLWDYFAEHYYVFESFVDYMRFFEKKSA